MTMNFWRCCSSRSCKGIVDLFEALQAIAVWEEARSPSLHKIAFAMMTNSFGTSKGQLVSGKCYLLVCKLLCCDNILRLLKGKHPPVLVCHCLGDRISFSCAFFLCENTVFWML